MEVTMVDISKNLIEPICSSNIMFVESLDQFEKIQIDPNKTILAFDNYQQCFYVRSRNAMSEYSRTKIYFYEDFAQRVHSINREEFISKCKALGYKADKIEIACLLFIDCWSHQAVSDWLWKNKGEIIEYDSMRTKKSRMRKELYPELVRNKQNKNKIK